MNIEFGRSFEKQLDKINDSHFKAKISEVVKSVIQSHKITDISGIKKLKGYKTAYRIRSGDYRIGIIFEHKTVYFIALYHRKEIYKYFP